MVRTVMNPATGERIAVGSERYYELLATGRVRDSGGGVLQPLVRAVDDLEVRVHRIQDPSNQSEEDRDTILRFPASQRTADAVNAYVAGAPWDTTIGPLLENQFLRDNATDLTIGPFHFRRNANDPYGALQAVDIDFHMFLRMVQRERERNLRADNPLRIPYTNIDLNPGSDAMCVARFLGVETRPRSLTGMLILAQSRDIPVVAYDILGNERCRSHPDADNRPDVHRCIVYADHVYPITFGTEPKRIDGPLRFIEEEYPDRMTPPDAFQRLVYLEKNAMVYEQTRSLLIANTGQYDGIWMPRRPTTEDWMGPLIRAVPECVWDEATMSMFAQGTSVLSYSATCIREQTGQSLDRFATIDMSKCYYNVMRYLCDQVAFPMLGANVFTRFVPFDPSKDKDDAVAFYLVQEDLREYGITRNLLPYVTLNLLRKHGVRVTPFAICHMVSLGMNVGKKLAQAMEDHVGSSAERQKKVARVVGIWGITSRTYTQRFELCSHEPNRGPSDDEVAYYTTRYPDWHLEGRYMRRISDKLCLMNRFHAYVSILHYANFVVLQKLFEIREDTGRMPVKIRVDSLTYQDTPFTRAKDLLEPFMHSQRLKWWYEPIVAWKPEDPKYAPTDPSPVHLSLQDQPRNQRNVCFVGPPGTGKTTRAIREYGDVIDFYVCYSNRGRVRLSAMAGVPLDRCKTVHGLFGVWDTRINPNISTLSHLRDATVLLDEGQAVNRTMWGWFVMAMAQLNTRLITCMDPDQVSPVKDMEDKAIPIAPFMGRVIRLLHNYRNDDALIEARQQVLAGTYRATLTPLSDDTVWTRQNIAYYRKTCEIVNKDVTWRLGLAVGDPATRYLVRKPWRKTLVRGDVVVYDGRCLCGDAVVGAYVYLTAGELIDMMRRGILDWGYCLTVHSTVGATLDGPVTFWDWDDHDMDPSSVRVRYTAITRVRSLDGCVFRSSPSTSKRPREEQEQPPTSSFRSPTAEPDDPPLSA